MSSSLLIKGMDGTVIGYALVFGGQLCIRINEQSIRGTARLSDGETERFVQIDGGGKEQTFRWNGDRRIAWILIEREGKTLALGGNIPERVCGTSCTREDDLADDLGKNTQTQSACVKSEKISLNGMGQRRWPPPPCWLSALYLDGEWKDGEESS